MNADGARPAPLWARLTATVFGVGRLPLAPGTWGSAAGVLLWWIVGRSVPFNLQWLVASALAAFVILIGIPAATRVARAAHTEDPQFVVIDEVAGQIIALIAAPLSWKSLLVGFILFRGFDTVKPPPIRQLENLPEGTGIVMDDVAAGLCAFAVMQVLLHFGVPLH